MISKVERKESSQTSTTFDKDFCDYFPCVSISWHTLKYTSPSKESCRRLRLSFANYLSMIYSDEIRLVSARPPEKLFIFQREAGFNFAIFKSDNGFSIPPMPSCFRVSPEMTLRWENVFVGLRWHVGLTEATSRIKFYQFVCSSTVCCLCIMANIRCSVKPNPQMSCNWVVLMEKATQQ